MTVKLGYDDICQDNRHQSLLYLQAGLKVPLLHPVFEQRSINPLQFFQCFTRNLGLSRLCRWTSFVAECNCLEEIKNLESRLISEVILCGVREALQRLDPCVNVNWLDIEVLGNSWNERCPVCRLGVDNVEGSAEFILLGDASRANNICDHFRCGVHWNPLHRNRSKRIRDLFDRLRGRHQRWHPFLLVPHSLLCCWPSNLADTVNAGRDTAFG